MIERMKGHHIVCGCGRLGAEVVKELHRNHAPVVAIESDEKAIQQEIAPLNIPFIQGNATETGILQQAAVEKASTLVTCLPNDADNVYICLTARSTNRQLTIISRASQSNSEDLLRKAGADRVIFPYQLAGYRMALHCVRRAVTRFLDTISEDFRFDEVVIPQGSSISGKELKDSGIRQTANVIVVGVLGGDGVLRPNPTPDMVLNESDTLILLGSGDQLSRVRDMVAKTK
jgi:voltage-gated potassium channel